MLQQRFLQLCLCLAMLALIAGCAAPQKETVELEPSVKPMSVSVTDKEQKVDNFLVLLDTSGSKLQQVGGEDLTPAGGTAEAKRNLLRRSKRILLLMNQTIPYELNLHAGLRAFGQLETESGKQKTALLYGMSEYIQSGLRGGINAAPNQPKGLTYIGSSIDGASQDLGQVSGKTAVILLSDGMTPADDPVRSAAELARKYGKDVCLYAIHMGDNQTGRALLNNVVNQVECGSVVEDTAVETPSGMADFVEQVFLAEAAKPEPKPEPKAPVDSDGDGYADPQDMCPNTPEGVQVDSNGCWAIDNVLFDFDQANIRPAFESTLNSVAMAMRQNPDLTLTVHGHTDSIGTEAYNQELSKRRAEAVQQFISRNGVEPERISIQAHGESDPVASNETEQGRQKNRRAVLQPSRQ
jgi:OOP family OmpA-OmpF porin